MDEKDWRLLDVLYKCKNITKAAEKLFMTQPALTYRIRLIEEDFGIKIIVRNKKGIQFTSEGEYLVKYAREMLAHLRKTRDQILNIGNKIQGTLRLGVSSNFAHYKLPKIIKKFLELYPKVEVNLKTGLSAEILALLRNDEIHVGIVRGNYDWHEQKYLIYNEKLCLISMNEINFNELPKMNQIHCKTDPLMQKLMDDWWNYHFKTAPLITMEVDRVETQIEMIRNRLGFGIIPRICLKKDDDFYTYDLTINNKDILRETWLFYTNSANQLSIVRAFVDFIKHCEIKSP